MAFRTLEITKAAEIHILNGQLVVAQEEGTVTIPIEDLVQINCIGANIRLSTMDLSILARNRISLLTLDDKYLPTAISLPFAGNARTSQLIHYQIEVSESTTNIRKETDEKLSLPTVLPIEYMEAVTE